MAEEASEERGSEARRQGVMSQDKGLWAKGRGGVAAAKFESSAATTYM